MLIINLNNDGIVDLKLEIFDSYPYPYAPGVGVQFKSNGLQKWEVFAYQDCQGDYLYGYGVVPFKNGQPIPTVGSTKFGNWEPASYPSIINFDKYGQTCHRWAGAKMRFAVLRYTPDFSYTDFYYAWIRLSVNEVGKHVKIHDWAFNTQLNEELFAGQTMKISNNIDSDGFSVPRIFSYGRDIHIQQSSESKALEISIFNATGQLLYETQTSDNSITLSDERWTPGIYAVRIVTDEGTFSEKVILL